MEGNVGVVLALDLDTSDKVLEAQQQALRGGLREHPDDTYSRDQHQQNVACLVSH